MTVNGLNNTFIAEALELMKTNQLKFPNLGPFEAGDVVLDELTDLEKALLLISLRAGNEASKIQESIASFCAQGKSYPSEMIIAQTLQESKAEFVTLCAKFLFLQRLGLPNETGIYLRGQGVIVVNKEQGLEDVVSDLLGSAAELLPNLIGRFFEESSEPGEKSAKNKKRKK